MSRTVADRKPVKQRAGTAIDHRFAEEIRGQAKGPKVHGVIDQSQRVYQTGGELSNFVYWAKRLVSLDMSVWSQIQGLVDTLEFIDHTKNLCYQTTMEYALTHGVAYSAGIGQRWGIPLAGFEVVDADGKIVKERGMV